MTAHSTPAGPAAGTAAVCGAVQSSPLTPALASWLAAAVGEDGALNLQPLSGGNSNETYRLIGSSGSWILRRPPAASIGQAAHNLGREHTVLSALARLADPSVPGRPVPAPCAIAFTDDRAVVERPVLVIEDMAGTPLTDRVPVGWPEKMAGHGVVEAIGLAAIDALAALHAVDWQGLGLAGFGRPDGYLARQVPRWQAQYAQNRSRELPLFDRVAARLQQQVPRGGAPALLHGDYHLDNCLFLPPDEQNPAVRVNAVIDWELATIGDPLVDLGLLLAFWGDERPSPVAMPRVQALTRQAGAPGRAELAERYALASGRALDELDWYLALALFKLAAIVEGAYARYLSGELDSDYARDLAADVPRLLDEAAGFAGL